MIVFQDVQKFIISLQHKPIIDEMGLYVHGYESRESFIHSNYWSLHVYRYEGQLKINDVRYEFRPGYASLIPPNVEAEWKFPRNAPHYVAHFSLKGSKKENFVAPLIQDLGEDYERIGLEFEKMIGFRSKHTLRSEIRLWDLLIDLVCDEDPQLFYASQPIIATTREYINEHLAQKITVEGIAERYKISHSTLSTQFKKYFKCTVSRYIRQQRVKKALKLIYNTTLTIKLIAIEVGIPDLQHFNKIIREDTGMSPRKLREEYLKNNYRFKLLYDEK